MQAQSSWSLVGGAPDYVLTTSISNNIRKLAPSPFLLKLEPRWALVLRLWPPWPKLNVCSICQPIVEADFATQSPSAQHMHPDQLTQVRQRPQARHSSLKFGNTCSWTIEGSKQETGKSEAEGSTFYAPNHPSPAEDGTQSPGSIKPPWAWASHWQLHHPGQLPPARDRMAGGLAKRSPKGRHMEKGKIIR